MGRVVRGAVCGLMRWRTRVRTRTSFCTNGVLARGAAELSATRATRVRQGRRLRLAAAKRTANLQWAGWFLVLRRPAPAAMSSRESVTAGNPALVVQASRVAAQRRHNDVGLGQHPGKRLGEGVGVARPSRRNVIAVPD